MFANETISTGALELSRSSGSTDTTLPYNVFPVGIDVEAPAIVEVPKVLNVERVRVVKPSKPPVAPHLLALSHQLKWMI